MSGLQNEVFWMRHNSRCDDFVPRPPVAFGNACVYRGFGTGGLQIGPPLHLP